LLGYYIAAFLIHHFTAAVGCHQALQRDFMGYYTESLNFISLSICSPANCIQCRKYCLGSLGCLKGSADLKSADQEEDEQEPSIWNSTHCFQQVHREKVFTVRTIKIGTRCPEKH